MFFEKRQIFFDMEEEKKKRTIEEVEGDVEEDTTLRKKNKEGDKFLALFFISIVMRRRDLF